MLHHLGNKHFLVVLILLIGLVVGVVLISQNQDLRSRAFTGYSFNGGTGLQNMQSDPLISNNYDSNSVAFLFHSLVRDYPDAATQNIIDEATNVTGVASLAYDSEIDKTFVFIRLQNVPYFELTPLNMWFVNSNSNITNRVATAEFQLEEELPVAYFIYSSDGDVRNTYDTAVISYEDIDSRTIILPILTLQM